MNFKKLFTLICFFYISYGYSQNSFLEYSDTINKPRVIGVSSGQISLVGLSSVGLYSLWYSKESMSEFHFFNDWNNWNNMDKAGHIYSAYHLSKISSNLFSWAGVNKKKSVLLGSSIGLGFQSIIEIMDGFSSKWGFSYSDMGSNIIGTSLFAGQELLFNKQILIPKFSYHNTPYSELRPEVLGRNQIEKILKDYNGQSYWISFSPKSILNSISIPEWFCFSFGYSIDQRIYGDQNSVVFQNQEYISNKEILFSLDIDLSKIKCKNAFIKTILNQLNYLKIPFPTVSFSSNKLTFYPLYF
ncbi:MAG: DUF2279 domain-containing protein [Crocinitomicaceae bacterium]|nr:DUF2279 domain-containing protein [Crocinitomicaceae bacterium]